ncbi:NAD(P)-dependent oxidoreductase [Bradyrhizobium sp.]|uniref:SDR family oxidoreductase n=1 Tax=Bradyrhizobium sp. TaxID=376 RepID=UPI00260F67BE|nr:NAD(P)-dependent oxidoreductase [Bradyrhizobium sp.]
MEALVFGASGMVGELILEHLAAGRNKAIGISRRMERQEDWLVADLAQPDTLQLPKVDVVFSAAPTWLFAKSAHKILRSEPKRIVVISSTNVFTKIDSRDEAERTSILELIDAEKRIIDQAKAQGVEWTILRPTLLYREGRDHNITQIARIIRRLGFAPLYGAAAGLRQPVHAEDYAIGAIAAAESSKAANRSYCTTGAETIPYYEMVGRIFDGLSRRRRLLHLPPSIWKSAFAVAKPLFPDVTPVMGERMLKDMAFDSSAAISDFGWSARKFAPSF